jgi:integrase
MPAIPFTSISAWEAEQLHDFVLFLGNTGLRPGEARNLEYRDVATSPKSGSE